MPEATEPHYICLLLLLLLLLVVPHLDFVRLFNEARQVLHAAGGREGARDCKHDHLLAFAQLVCAELLHVALGIKVAELGLREFVPNGQSTCGDADTTAAGVWPYAAGDPSAGEPLEGAAPAAVVDGGGAQARTSICHVITCSINNQGLYSVFTERCCEYTLLPAVPG
jgi:hypothetical protein